MTRALLTLSFLAMATCTGPPALDLSDLAVVDSVYVDPATDRPYTGPVFRPFADEADRVQVEGQLLEGEWSGEFVVYHVNGRVRYAGSFNRGERCGPWTENADSVVLESVYQQLVREVESMGVYPPCEEGR